MRESERARAREREREREKERERERERECVREFPKPKALPDEGTRLGKHTHSSPGSKRK